MWKSGAFALVVALLSLHSVPVQSAYIMGDVTIQDTLLGLYEVLNGVVHELVNNPFPIEWWVTAVRLQWRSPSQYYYSVDMSVLNPEVSDPPTLSIPYQGRIPANFEQFTGYFHCVDAGMAKIIFSIKIWNGPTQYSILLPFQKICASPCTTCHQHNSSATWDAFSGCQCTGGYQTPCCDVGLWANQRSASEVCQGDPVALAWHAMNYQPSDRVWLFPAAPDVNVPVAVNFSVALNATSMASLVSNMTGAQNNWTAARMQRIYDSNPDLSLLFDLPAYDAAYATITPGGEVRGTIPYALWGMPPGDYNVAYVNTNAANGAHIDAVATIRLLPPNHPACLAKLEVLPGGGTCLKGQWNTTTNQCDCFAGYFGNQCDHGCSSRTLTAQSMRGLTTDDLGGELLYINNMHCEWHIQPAYRNTSAIVLAFHRFGTQPNTDTVTVFSGLPPAPGTPECTSSFVQGTLEPALNCTRIYGVLSGTNPQASIVVPGRSVSIRFRSDHSISSWTSGTNYVGFSLSYHALTCLQPHPTQYAYMANPPTGVDTGTCMQCGPDALANALDGSLSPAAAYVGCAQCDSSTFMVAPAGAAPGLLVSGCGGCSPPSRAPFQPDFVEFCDPFWPPPSVDLSPAAFGVLLTSGALITTTVTAALLLVCCVYRLSSQKMRSLSPFGPDQKLLADTDSGSGSAPPSPVHKSQASKPSSHHVLNLASGPTHTTGLHINTSNDSQMSAHSVSGAVPSSPSSMHSQSVANVSSEVMATAAAVGAPLPRTLFKADMFPFHLFYALFLCGALLVCLSAFVAMFPQTDAMCSSSMVMLILGAQLMLSMMCIQAYRLRELWALSTQRFPQHMPYDHYARLRRWAGVATSLLLALDGLLLIVGFSLAPLAIESGYRKWCTYRPPLITCLALSVAVKFGLCALGLRWWWPLRKLPNPLNDVRFVGWVIPNTVIAVVLAFALIFGGGDPLADGGGATAVRIAVQFYVVAVPLYLFYYTRFMEMRATSTKDGGHFCADEVIASIKSNTFGNNMASLHTASFAATQTERAQANTRIAEGSDPLVVLEEELRRMEARMADKRKQLETDNDVLYDIFERVKQLKVQQYFFHSHQKRSGGASTYRSMLVAASERIMFRNWDKSKRYLLRDAGKDGGDSKASFIDEREGGTSAQTGARVGLERPGSAGPTSSALRIDHSEESALRSHSPPSPSSHTGILSRFARVDNESRAEKDNDVSRSEVVLHGLARAPSTPPTSASPVARAKPALPSRAGSIGGGSGSHKPSGAEPASASASASGSASLPRAGSTEGAVRAPSPGSLPRAGSIGRTAPGLPPRAGSIGRAAPWLPPRAGSIGSAAATSPGSTAGAASRH